MIDNKPVADLDSYHVAISNDAPPRATLSFNISTSDQRITSSLEHIGFVHTAKPTDGVARCASQPLDEESAWAVLRDPADAFVMLVENEGGLRLLLSDLDLTHVDAAELLEAASHRLDVYIRLSRTNEVLVATIRAFT